MADGGAGAEVFGERVDAWASWQSSPWGRLRYSLVQATLGRVLVDLPAPLRIIDVGGGDGADSLPLAQLGHDVTILDFAGPLLDAASDAAAEVGVADRVHHVHADLADLDHPRTGEPDLLGRFDVVLCHNVLHYRDDLDGAVRTLLRLLRPSGIASLLAPNPAMDVLSAAVRRTDPARASTVLDSPTILGETFVHEMRRLYPATVEAAVEAAGCLVRRRFGIRCVTDLIADNEIKHDPDFFRDLEQLELQLCEREPYWRIARFWQLIASRPVD